MSRAPRIIGWRAIQASLPNIYEPPASVPRGLVPRLIELERAHKVESFPSATGERVWRQRTGVAG